MVAKKKRWMQVAAAVLAGLCLWNAGRGLAADHGINTPMFDDPGVTDTPRVPAFEPRLKDLWTAALDRPEAEMRLHALDAITQARLQKMPDLDDLTPRIKTLLEDDKQPEAIHSSAVRALDAIDAKSTGPAILARAQKGTNEFLLLADPVLARWKVSEAGPMWIARVKDPAASEQAVASAIQSLGETTTEGGADALKTVINDTQRPIATRLTASQALACYPASTLGSFTDDFAAGKTFDNHLLAAAMLPVSKDEHVVRLLSGLAQDAEPAVVAIAAGKLWTGARETMAPLAAKLAENPDLAVRKIAVDALHHHANPAHVVVLGKLLDDDSPAVRAAAREALIDIDAKPDLRNAVRQAAKTALTAGVHAQEQGGFIVGSLHENSARDRLVELLASPEPPVRLAAVIGLRRLNTGDQPVSDTLAAQYARALSFSKGAVEPGKPKTAKAYVGENIELSQLLQNLGLGRFTEADGYMRKFIPKHAPWGMESRMGAIWALGLLHEGKVDAGLSKDLVSRVLDNNVLDPEAIPVRTMSAVALGRMRDKSARGALSKTATDEVGNVLGESCRWAIAQIDGVKYEPTPSLAVPVKGWFLEPN